MFSGIACPFINCMCSILFKMVFQALLKKRKFATQYEWMFYIKYCVYHPEESKLPLTKKLTVWLITWGHANHGSRLLLETTGAHINNSATSHISQVHKVSKYLQQDNWQHNSLERDECTERHWVSFAQGQVPHSFLYLSRRHHLSCPWCRYPSSTMWAEHVN